MFGREKCKHEWDIVVKETMPSIYEEYIRITGGAIRHSVSPIDLKKKMVVILCCKLCGELDKNTYDNYD